MSIRRLLCRAVAALVLASLASVAPATATGDGRNELVIFTWSEYIDPGVVAEFERETGAAVRFVYYESDDTRTRTMTSTGGAEFDLILVAGVSLRAYVRRGWVAPLSEMDIGNLDHVSARWRTAFEDARTHGVPYFWGTTGIAYRRDLVPEPIRSWRQLFVPDETLRGRIIMVRSTRDLVGMALKALGYSANSEQRSQIDEAGRLLLDQKPFVRSYVYSSLSEKSPLVRGDAWAAIMYSGDALLLKSLHPSIEYVVPVEGSNLWADYFVVSSSSSRKRLAARFLGFLNRPDIAARNAEYLHYATPNEAGLELLPAEFRADPVVFPSAEVLSQSEVYRELPPRAMKSASAVVARVVN